ncbi:DUF4292 domain-containing protein [Tenacibaculum jejuense]|uniref:Probable lipoprotein n=1 Tax=Tenacibaculum jejuense TaxID=584609 RepID=A0A238U3S0_9FLAO|nr:DUF4292 domain-containing protein [Tenacibaculum jejuense]SNR13853.1 Probable lipoprotein precursor [Tenacibaculum jejuense]
MKKVYLILTTLIIATLSSCKSTKETTSTATLKNLSARRVVKKHLASNFEGNTIDAKLKVRYKDKKEDIGFSVKMKIKKDEVIWLKGTKIITVFKAKITPEKVSFYSPYKKNYFEGDFSMLKELLGFDVNFEQLQNMLLGQAVLDITENKQKVDIVNRSYQLYPKKQPLLFDIFYQIHPDHYKLKKQYLVNQLKEQRLDIDYADYIKKDNLLFPKRTIITAKEKNKFTNINIEVRSINFNTNLEMPFRIPSGYKEIKL